MIKNGMRRQSVICVLVISVVAAVLSTTWRRVDDARIVRYTYTLQRYESRASDASPMEIFKALVEVLWPQATDWLNAVTHALTRCVGSFVWGVQRRGLEVNLEFYFYASDVRVLWPCVADILHLEPLDASRISFVPQMVSVEIDVPAMRGTNIDIYHIQDDRNGYCIRHGTYVVRNIYRFALKPYRRELGWRRNPCAKADARLRRLMANVGLSSAAVLFRDWRISACVAVKTNRRKGLYFSGVPVKSIQASKHFPKIMKRALSRLKTHHTLLDVGYDLIGADTTPRSFCVYGSFS